MTASPRMAEAIAALRGRKSAITLLHQHGIELAPSRKFTLEQIEALAEVVRNWED